MGQAVLLLFCIIADHNYGLLLFTMSKMAAYVSRPRFDLDCNQAVFSAMPGHHDDGRCSRYIAAGGRIIHFLDAQSTMPQLDCQR